MSCPISFPFVSSQVHGENVFPEHMTVELSIVVNAIVSRKYTIDSEQAILHSGKWVT